MLSLFVPEEIITLINNCNNAAILTHQDPDADALGSAVALQRTLIHQNKFAAIFCSGDVSPQLQTLFGIDDLIQDVSSQSLELLEGSDLIILCDTREPSRVGDWYKPLVRAMTHLDTLAIDHHVAEKYDFSYVWANSSASSTAEMMTSLIQKLNGEFSQDIATCLAAGIVDDTGYFRNTNSTSTALETTAYLVRQGANLNHINEHLDTPARLSAIKLQGDAISRIQAEFGGRYIWTTISYHILESYGVKENELNSLNRQLRVIEGVQVSSVFFEQAPQQTLVSLRSKAGYDVQSIASQFAGGGGHRQAAGCTVPLDLQSTQTIINEKVRLLFKSR